ncbi:palindromic element RPE1 domain-containing protein [Candidatus Tisiphia endosymbiont of Dioctria rufipes]|uniref:palindromic element RPE1 domain-containing protein n=1 Tax=Candidatus Tisiphia endosymbiont of Dioctria rufipes TaxID=3066255 RepID=UPI00312C7013
MKIINRLLSKLACAEGFEGDAKRRTAAYSNVCEDLSTASTYKSPAKVEFQNRSNIKRLTILLTFILLPLSEVVANSQEYFEKANALITEDKWQEAIDSYDLAIKHKPDFADAYYNRGITLGKLGKLQEEIVAYDLAIKYKPDYVKAYYNKGIALKELGKYSQSEEAFSKAERLRTKH